MIVTVTAKVTFHQISLPSSKGRRVITKMNFLLITESVRITKDHSNCHSAFGNLYKFSVVCGGLSHIRQCANEEHKNNSSNTSENKTVAEKHFLERNMKIQTKNHR